MGTVGARIITNIMVPDFQYSDSYQTPQTYLKIMLVCNYLLLHIALSQLPTMGQHHACSKRADDMIPEI